VSIASAIDARLQAAVSTIVAAYPAGPNPVVAAGEPDVVNMPTIAYWYTGTDVWESHTLSEAQEVSGWHIRIQLPAGPRFTPSNAWMEGWLEDAVNAVRAQFLGHAGLGGAATGQGGLVGGAKAGWADTGGQWSRLADMDLPVFLSNVHPIAV
jgi:hypothetical protein